MNFYADRLKANWVKLSLGHKQCPFALFTTLIVLSYSTLPPSPLPIKREKSVHTVGGNTTLLSMTVYVPNKETGKFPDALIDVRTGTVRNFLKSILPFVMLFFPFN